MELGSHKSNSSLQELSSFSVSSETLHQAQSEVSGCYEPTLAGLYPLHVGSGQEGLPPGEGVA